MAQQGGARGDAGRDVARAAGGKWATRTVACERKRASSVQVAENNKLVYVIERGSRDSVPPIIPREVAEPTPATIFKTA